ncbi:MAG TPA: CsgG/HfaB family protein [Syntrophales bacterium]|nr:CsgG/HfaB family protein [Syntrophales bacterium]
MKPKNCRISLIGLIFLFLFGCGADESYKQPDQDMFRQRREEAASIYDKAKQSLTGAEPNLIVLEQLAKDVENAARLDPDNSTIAAFSSSLNEKAEGMRTKLKSLYGDVEADMRKEDWVAAADKLKQINGIFPNYEDTSVRLAKVAQEGAKQLYQQGLALSRQEDWKMAAQAFKSAMDINPNYYDVAKLYQDASSRDNFAYFIAEGEKAGQSQNWDRAILMFTKAGEYQPDNMELYNKIASIKTKVGHIYFAEAVKLVNQGVFCKAMEKINRAQSYSSALQDDSAYKDFINKFCAKLMERAEKFAERELWGNAIIWLQKVEALNPNYQNLFQKYLEAKDGINKRIRKSIAVLDFGSPSNAKDAGKIAANKLIAYLHKNASGDLRLIERENLKSILGEMQLGQTGLVEVDTKTMQNVGKMRGIDTFIMGEVLKYSAVTQDNPSSTQVQVLGNEYEDANPNYSYWMQTHPRPTAEDWASAPPQTVKKRNPSTFISYKQGIAKITAMLEVSYKLVDTTTGENIFTNNISGKSVKEDKYQDAVPVADISLDPLTLPTEMEVLDELTSLKMIEVGQSVLKQYQSLEVEYYKQGQLQEKRRNFELAVEKYTDAIFDEGLKGAATLITQKSQETINKLAQDK